jgi:DNA-binding transcriptional LysR family regulator
MLPQLRVFEAVSRHGNFTRAAEELYMAQPTVSVQIRKLTETIGLPLFEHVGKRVFPTEAGRKLYCACQAIVKAFSDVEEAFSAIRGLESGSLRITVSSAGKYLAPRLLAEFVKSCPGVAVSVHVERRQTVLQRLGDNLDDLYILGNAPEGDDVIVQRLVPNPLLVFACPNHPLAGERSVPFARLAREPLLMRERGSGTRIATERLFAGHGVEPSIRMELGSSEAIMEAVQAGLGIAILYRHSIAHEPDATRAVALDVEGFPVESHVNLVYPVGKQLSVVAQAFIEFARGKAKQMALDHAGTSNSRPAATVLRMARDVAVDE